MWGSSGKHICHFEMFIFCFFLHSFWEKELEHLFLDYQILIGAWSVWNLYFLPYYLYKYQFIIFSDMLCISLFSFLWQFTWSYTNYYLCQLCPSYLESVTKYPGNPVFEISWWILASNTLLPQSVVHVPLSACMLSRFSHVQLFVILWTMARQDPLSMGSSRQEYWSGLSCPPPGDLPNPGIKPASPTSPAVASRFFTTSTTWETPIYFCWFTKIISCYYKETI